MPLHSENVLEKQVITQHKCALLRFTTGFAIVDKIV